MPNGPPPKDFDFIGGKHDDITMTVAQIFYTQNGEKKGTAERDTYFPDAKTVYTKDVPLISYDKLKRARFHKKEEQFPPENEEL